jgi:hypothetical protein
MFEVWRHWLVVVECFLFAAHVVLVSIELAHWSASRSDDQRVAAVNTLALLSFHFCILTPLLLLTPTSKNRHSFAVTALAWAYALSIGLCIEVVLETSAGIIALLACTIAQSALACIVIWNE